MSLGLQVPSSPFQLKPCVAQNTDYDQKRKYCGNRRRGAPLRQHIVPGKKLSHRSESPEYGGGQGLAPMVSQRMVYVQSDVDPLGRRAGLGGQIFNEKG